MDDEPFYIVSLEQIESSSLTAAGYDPHKRILAVQFTSGQVFNYAGISPALALDFYAATSRGRFYGEHIRGKFVGSRRTGPCPQCGREGYDTCVCESCGPGYRHAVPPRKVRVDKEEEEARA